MSSLLNFAKRLKKDVVNTLDRDKSREGFQLISQNQKSFVDSGVERVKSSFSNPQKYNFYGELSSGKVDTGFKPLNKAGQLVGSVIQKGFINPAMSSTNALKQRQQKINERTQNLTFSQRLSRKPQQDENILLKTGLSKGAEAVGSIMLPRYAPQAAIGGGFNFAISKASGNTTKQALSDAASGARMAPVFSSIANITNPIINKNLVRLPKKLPRFVSDRIAPATANVIQGVGIDLSTGQKTTPSSLAFDATTGLFGGRGQFDSPNAKGFDFGRNRRSKWHPEDVDLLDELSSYVNEKNISGGVLEGIDRDVTDLARGYLPVSKIQELSNTYKSDSKRMLKATIRELQKSAKNANGGNYVGNGRIVLGVSDGRKSVNLDINDPKFKQLDNLFNDPNRLLRMGYSKDQVGKIGVKEARQIIEKNILPGEHRTYKKTLDLDPQRKEIIGLTGKDPGAFIEKPSNEFISPDDSKRMAGEAYLAEMEGWNDFKGSIKKWVGNRDVANTVATEKAMKFTNIAKEDAWDVVRGLEGKPSNKEGVNNTVRAIRSEYDSLINEARNSGVDINYLENYVTHIWKEPFEEVQKIMSARGKFKYNKSRVLPTYDEGIELGLTPKYTHPAQIIEAYVSNLERAKANVQFMNELKDQGLLVPASVARNNPDFKPVKAAGIGGNVTEMADGKTYVGDWYAPTKVADTINKVFSEPNEDLVSKSLGAVANLSSKVQDFTLSGGLMGTPINAFTAANIQKELLALRIKSPVMALFRSLSPSASENYFRQNIETIKKMQRNNISVRTQFNIEDMIEKPLLKKLGWSSMMNDPTFKRFLPQLQIQFFNDIESAALKSGKLPEEAELIASNALKNFYGTITSDKSALRSQNSKNLTTSVFFAPQFRESMINFWKNNVGAISPVKAEFNREGVKKVVPSNVRLNNPLSLENRNNTKFLIGSALTLAVMDKLNYILNGHPMSENPEGKEDKLLVPLGDGTTIGIPFLSSISTLPRGVYRQGRALLRGDTQAAAKDAFSTYTSSLIKPVAENLMNQDYFGNQIYDPNDATGQKFMAQGAHLAKSYMHPYAREILNASTERLPISDNTKKSLGIRTEKTPLYQSLSQGMELPIRFYKTESVKNAPFWDSYYKNKAISEKYGQLKNSDPQKATEYLQANKQAIGEFEKQKRYVGRYYDSGKDSKVLQQYVGNNNSNIVQASTGNNQQNDGELSFLDPYFGISDYNSMPEQTAMQKAQKEAKKQKLVKDMLTNEDVSPEQKITALNSMDEKYDTTDIDYYQTAKLNNDIKVGFVKDYLAGTTDEDRSQSLSLLTQEVAGEKVLSSGVLSTLYKEGIISKGEQNALKNITFDKTTGQVVSKASSGRSKSVNVKGTTPKVSVPSSSPVKVNISVAKPSLPSTAIKVPTKTPSLINDDSLRELLALAKTDRTKPITFNKIRVRG